MNIKNKFKKAIFGGLAALVIASAGCNKSNPINPEEPEPKKAIPLKIEYKSYYTPYKCSSAKINGDFTGWAQEEMKKVSENCFSYVDTVYPGNYCFNIESRIAQFPDFSDWAATRDLKGTPCGIRAAWLKINSNSLDNQYLIDAAPYGAANFSISVSECGTISPGSGNHFNIDGRIPPETRQKGSVSLSVPQDYNSGWNAGLAWMQAVHKGSGTSKVQVNYTRLYAKINGQDTLLATCEYHKNPKGFLGCRKQSSVFQHKDSNFWRGKWIRYPWFITDEHENLQVQISNGWLILKPSDFPDKVAHWGTPRAVIPSNAEYCWSESEIEINGNAVVQAGIDFWKNTTAEWAGYNVNNTEAGISNWYFENSGRRQTIKLILNFH